MTLKNPFGQCRSTNAVQLVYEARDTAAVPLVSSYKLNIDLVVVLVYLNNTVATVLSRRYRRRRGYGAVNDLT